VKVIGGLLLLFIGLNMLAKDTVNVDLLSAAKAASNLRPI
jgi:small neutral amino acid transporter SnatA (MarC family)